MEGIYHTNYSEYLIQNGILFKGEKLCIPKLSMRENIIREKNCSGLGSHFGIDKIADMVKRSYFWPKMNNEVKKFIECCTIFQQDKGMKANQRLYQPLPNPSRPWESISMDFVMGLSKTK